MAQPKPSPRKEWFLFVLEIDEPIPDATGRIMLPTCIMLLDGKGNALTQPELLPEIDQPRIENLLEEAMDEHAQPERIILSTHEDWDESAWQAFSKEFDVEIQFRDFSAGDLTSRVKIAQVGSITGQNAEQIAQALLETALTLRSQRRREAFFKKCIALTPGLSAARIELADIAFGRGEFDECLQAYRRVSSTEKTRWHGTSPAWWEDHATRPYLRALYGEAMTLWHQGKHLRAAAVFENLLAINPTDHQGVRFYLPMVYLLADAWEDAADFYERYEKRYPRDFADPALFFGWGLLLSSEGEEDLAKQKYQTAILRNIYLAPALLGEPQPPAHLWMPNERAEPGYAQEFVRSFASLWERDAAALRLVREAWEESQPRVAAIIACREKITDFQDQRYDPDYKKHWEALLEEEARLTGSSNQF